MSYQFPGIVIIMNILENISLFLCVLISTAILSAHNILLSTYIECLRGKGKTITNETVKNSHRLPTNKLYIPRHDSVGVISVR